MAPRPGGAQARKAAQAAKVVTYHADPTTAEDQLAAREDVRLAIAKLQEAEEVNSVSQKEDEQRQWDEYEDDEADCGDTEDGEEEKEEEKTRRASLLEQFMRVLSNMIAGMIAKHADARIGTPCSCGQGARTTRCRDCVQMPPSCVSCFIGAHKWLPFHWAEHWDEENGYFAKCDMSVLKEGWSIPLGHDGDVCPNAKGRLMHTVVESNGPHATYLLFCDCAGAPEKWQQLFDTNLFPGSLQRPRTSYSFRVLREFEVHSLASKKSARDYCKALAQLANRAFPGDNPIFYGNFRVVSRVWARVKSHIWTGQGHGVDSFMSRRPEGNLRIYCPACPEADVNLEEGFANAPSHLAHVHGSRKTTDGNFQLGHYAKHHDPRDVSLYNGQAYFVRHDVEQRYLEQVPQLQRDRPPRSTQLEDMLESMDKATCGYLHALENHDKSKFRGMDISGILAVLCDHVFIWSFVDMQFGERFSNADLALAWALIERPFDCDKVPTQTLSYDCQCKYCRHLLERITVVFPNLAYLLDDARFTIPAVHVRNHLDMCMWLFAAAFKECTGKFHGETAEQIWAEFNLLGAAVRQMSPGYRQDLLIQNATAWNLQKLMNIGRQLAKDCADAVVQYTQRREDLIALYRINAKHLERWMAMDRSPRVSESNKRSVTSVYSHDGGSVGLSYKQLLDRMMLSKEKIACGTWWIEETALGRWFREALSLEDEQANIARRKKLLKDYERGKDVRARAEVAKKEEELAWRRDVVLKHQRALMPGVLERVKVLLHSENDCEAVEVYLPSALSEAVREDFGLDNVSSKEAECRKRLAVSCVGKLRDVVRNLSALTEFKISHDRGQEQNTRSQVQVESYRQLWDSLIEDYNRHRRALVSLGAVTANSSEFRPLSLTDTARKSTTSARAKGDSRRRDGDLWTMGAGLAIADSWSDSVTKVAMDETAAEGSTPQSSPSGKAYGTQQSRRRSSPKKKRLNGAQQLSRANDALEKAVKESKAKGKTGRRAEDGWIWMKAIEGETDDAWAERQDRVKFFRDEAERDRWLEQVEIKHAEFHRVVRAFDVYVSMWRSIASEAVTAGHCAYARREAHKYAKLRDDASSAFARVGIPILRTIPAGKTLVDQILLFRSEEQCRYPPVKVLRPRFVDPTRNIKQHTALNPDDSEEEEVADSEREMVPLIREAR